MNENIKNAVDFAFSDNVADMQSELENALQYKIINALEAKRIEIAKSLINTNESVDPDEDEEELDEELKGKQHKLDVNKNKKLDAHDFKLLRKGKKAPCCEGWDDDEDPDVARADRELKRMKAKPIAAAKIDPDKDKIKRTKKDREEEMEESYIEEKLDSSMGVKKYIDDFIKSDNPKFEGKSKKERTQMALGAFYSAKKGKTRNEEVEGLEEVSKDLLSRYYSKAAGRDQDRNKRAKGKLMASRKSFPRQYANSDLKVKVPATDND